MHTTHTSNVKPPKWAAIVYALLAILLIPWITYLAVNLPTRHLSRHWDISWVGLDTAITVLLILNSIFVGIESDLLAISGTATATLLSTDAWFDIMSARPGRALYSAVSAALLLELPLALLAFSAALRALKSRKR